ncbi:nucleotide disphospho-sugar-binding domain-containing protein [Spongiactinospora sp. 9N601]|uniref:nucleotide disphospho-sugar-binding domain-containing protein n=1 Tax=Spongiactinospora sp. 9N601 TaxID=3375149 RepID=UPI003797D2AF
MRILISTIATAAHFYPVVPFAWALRCAGHDVRVACEPGFTATVAATGLPAVAVGQDVDLRTFWKDVPLDLASGDEPLGVRMDRSMVMFTGIAAAAAGDLIDFARAWRPDAVVFEARGYAGLVAAHAVGVPAVRHTWGIDTNYVRRDFDRPYVEELCARFGLTGVDPLGDLTLTPCPPGLAGDDDVNRVFLRYVPFNGPGVQPPWAAGTPALPRVCVTWGHMFSQITDNLHPINLAVEGLRDLPVEVVAAIAPGQRGLLPGDLPPNVRVAESVPLNLLLPSCSAVLNGGGAGTLMTALTAGVPMIIVPSHTDEPEYAERMSAAGAAVHLDYRGLDAGTFRTATEKTLAAPSFKEGAARLAAENAALPSPTDLAATLGKVLAQAGRG